MEVKVTAAPALEKCAKLKMRWSKTYTVSQMKKINEKHKQNIAGA